MKYIIPIILTLCIIIAYIQYGYKPDKILRKKPQSPLVEIAKIEKGSFNSILKMRGDLISKSELTVRTRIPGIVEKIIVEMGDSINKNQILLKLDDTEAQLKLAQSKADMLIAEGIVDQAKINHEVFEEKYSLNQKLYEKKLISKSELQKSQQETKKAIVGLSISKAKKKQAEINLQRSIVNLENCTIHSPWNKSGWVSDVHVNEGALVNNNGSVITIKDLNTLLAVGYVTERDYSRLKVGQQAEIYVQSFPEEIFTGNIVNISPSFDSKSRQAKFQLKINNQAGKLRPGMMASISIDTGIRADLNLLLKEAVIYYRGQQGVFLYNEEKKNAIFKKVILGEIKDDFAEVKSPKNLKGFVVTIGNHMLRSGRPVRVNTPTLKQANKGSQKKNKKAEK